MKKVLLGLFALVFVGCGAAVTTEDVDVTKDDLFTGFRVGDSTVYACCVSPEITYMYWHLTLPNAPYNPSIWSSFTATYKVGYTGVGASLNTVTFKVTRVNATPSYPAYYVATANITKDDGAGHLVSYPNLALVTAWPTDQFYLVWQNSQLIFQVQNAAGVHTWDLPPVGLDFSGLTHRPNSIYSPSVQFTMSTPTNCAHDMPGFDDDVQLDGHMDMTAMYGINTVVGVHFVNMSAPLTDSHCQLNATNFASDVYIDWHTGL